MILEFQRYGRNKETTVDSSYISGGEYRRKFDSIIRQRSRQPHPVQQSQRNAAAPQRHVV